MSSGNLAKKNAKASKKGGAIAKNARIELEQQTGRNVVTGENFLPPKKNELSNE